MDFKTRSQFNAWMKVTFVSNWYFSNAHVDYKIVRNEILFRMASSSSNRIEFRSKIRRKQLLHWAPKIMCPKKKRLSKDIVLLFEG